MSGLFVQFYRDDALITLPEEIGWISDESAWHFCFTETGNVYETYAKEEYICDAVEYIFYRKDDNSEVGIVTYGGRHEMFPKSMWNLRELLNEYGHRTVLPFIMVFGKPGEYTVRMPESGEEIFRASEAGLCKAVYYIAGFQQFQICDIDVQKREGAVDFRISVFGKELFRYSTSWDSEQVPFSDYQEQIKNPWNINAIIKDEEIDPDSDGIDIDDILSDFEF